MILASSIFAWILAAPWENPSIILITTATIELLYFAIFLFVTSFFCFHNINLVRAVISSMLGGAFISVIIMWGGAVYLFITKPLVALFVLATYLPIVAFLAYKKYVEAELEEIINNAKKRKIPHIHTYVFSDIDLPIKFKQGKFLQMVLLYPSLACGAIAAMLVRSDWQYSIAAPLMGASLLSMVCMATYGNFITFFYWVHYLRNKEEYVKFKNWPREQFVNEKTLHHVTPER